MFEYHGWVTLADSPQATDDHNLDRFLPELKQKIKILDDDFGVIGIKKININYQVWFMGCRNHRQEWVLDLFCFIAQRSRGSYGLLYIWDDEHPEYDNQFRVWRMAKGQVDTLKDAFLSPCIPTIEEA